MAQADDAEGDLDDDAEPVLLTRAVRRGTLATRCHPDMATEVEEMLGWVAGCETAAAPLREGSVVRPAWSPLTVRLLEGRLHLHEPVFIQCRHDELVPAVDWTLRFMYPQLMLAAEHGVKPTLASCWDLMMVSQGIETATRIMADRAEPARADDSGWRFHDLDRPDADVVTCHTIHLAHMARLLVAVLRLPVGLRVFYDGGRIERVEDGSGRVLPRTPGASIE